MADDIAPELLEKVQSDYRKLREKDEELARISERTAAGSADGKDLDAYAVREGELLAEALHRNVSGDVLPNGKMYFNIADRVLPSVLRENYDNVADMSERIIAGMNDRAGIHIRAQRPDLNEDRVNGLVNLAATADQYEERRKEIEADVVNFSQSVGTDTVRKNADFQYQSGLSPKIHRTAEGGCCKWCAGLAGTYDYASVKAGGDVWLRHRDCRCIVEFDPGNGKRQNAHTKAWRTDEDRAKRIQYSRETDEERQKQGEQARQERIETDKYARSERNPANWGPLGRGAADIGSGKYVSYDENADYRVEIAKYSDEVNKSLSEAARKVAMFGSRDKYEYASIIDIKTGEEVDFDSSKEYDSVNSYYRYLKQHLDGHFAMVHNHNTENGFSLADIQELEMWENLDSVIAVTNNGITYSVISNGLQSRELLSMEFEDIGKEESNYIEQEKKQVIAAVERYADGGITIYDGRSKRNN
ncbi:MAG: hypothetical protein J6P66_05835 [Bacteroidaceae bacterium]|nr:hypothetical protein [Bacteroidaceae bacterium]